MKWDLENYNTRRYTINLEQFQDLATQRHGAAIDAAIKSGALGLFCSIPIIESDIYPKIDPYINIDFKFNDFEINVRRHGAGSTIHSQNKIYSFKASSYQNNDIKLKFCSNFDGLKMWAFKGSYNDEDDKVKSHYYDENINNIFSNLTLYLLGKTDVDASGLITFVDSTKFLKSFELNSRNGHDGSTKQINYFDGWLSVVEEKLGPESLVINYDFVTREGIIKDIKINDGKPFLYSQYELLKHFN